MGLTLEGTVFCLDPLDSRCWCQEQEIQICVKFVVYAYTSLLITLWQVVYVCQYIFEDLNFLQIILVKCPSLLIYNVYFKNNSLYSKSYFYVPFCFSCRWIYNQKTNYPNICLVSEFWIISILKFVFIFQAASLLLIPKSHTLMIPFKVLRRYANAKLNMFYIQTNKHVTYHPLDICYFMC